MFRFLLRPLARLSSVLETVFAPPADDYGDRLSAHFGLNR